MDLFKDVDGYEGMYKICSNGEVISLPRTVSNGHSSYKTKLRILKPTKGSNGYLGVKLSKNGKRKYLGSFKTEIDAHKAYQKALKELTC